MKELMTGIVPLAVCLSLLSACTSHAEVFRYTDKLGRSVQLETPVKRAAVFQTNELIPALGTWDKIVAVSKHAYDSDVMVAARPDFVNTILAAGSGSNINMEALLKTRPDVVITWTLRPDAVRFMERQGLKVIAINPTNLDDLYEVMRLQGRLFGKEERAEFCISEMKKIVSIVQEGLSGISPQGRRKVLWLSGKPTIVGGGTGVTSDLLRMSAAVNPAMGIAQTSAEVSMERILSWNPDVILIWGYAKYTARTVLESPQWSHVKAVKDGRVYKAPPWSVWSPRAAPILLWMSSKIYPECFTKIDVESVLDSFYRRLYGISYEQVHKFER